jgi:hypothetical protein
LIASAVAPETVADASSVTTVFDTVTVVSDEPEPNQLIVVAWMHAAVEIIVARQIAMCSANLLNLICLFQLTYQKIATSHSSSEAGS